MTLFDRPISAETYAILRFGVGYPARDAPKDADAIMQRLLGPDHAAHANPSMPFRETLDTAQALVKAQKERRKMMGGNAAVKALREQIRGMFVDTLLTDLARAVETEDPFRERLQWFWANHFTARSKSIHAMTGHAGYGAEAIRAHVAGPFGELLKAAVTHPFMIVYLDQDRSVGPNSQRGLNKGRGLNENLAREVLELHTLGVGAAYSQGDVTEFAELLTGLSASYKRGGYFDPLKAEPGAESVMGMIYGGDGPAELADIHAALDDLARQPATAQFICSKLAAHFVADDPEADLVAHMVAAYRRSDGHLAKVYAAMLEHPASWRNFGAKVKWPFHLVASTMRAMDLRADDIRVASSGQVRKGIMRSLRQMGQDYQRPKGPDGWPDRAEAWIQPHGLAARIGWAMAAARRYPGGAPDPQEFLARALGDAAGSRLYWAAGVAESRAEGVGLVLASAEFNRR